jgi:putative SOS response-associated peptidase YedK
MPVILDQQDRTTWLRETEDEAQRLRSAPDGPLRVWLVDRRGGSPAE